MTLNEKLGREPAIVAEQKATGFGHNLAMIRPVAWFIAIALFVGMQCAFWFAIFPNGDPNEMEKMSLALKIFLPTLAASVLFVWALLVGYIYADAKRRGMRYVMWTLLGAFVPNAIGIILYFLLREPLPTPCPRCGKLARGSFAFCPHCGAELLRACRVCGKKLEPGWSNCAHCGTPVGAQPPRAA